MKEAAEFLDQSHFIYEMIKNNVVGRGSLGAELIRGQNCVRLFRNGSRRP